MVRGNLKMTLLIGYLATGALLLAAGIWHYQVSVNNIFADFTLISSLAITMLLAGLTIVLWPGFILSWKQVQN